MRILCSIGAVLLALAAVPAAGQSMPGDPAAGQRIALDSCARCHVVAESQPRPRPPTVDVPSFFDLAEEARVTEFYLRSFFRTSHRAMPNFMLTGEEADDIISYIFSLRGR